MIVLLRVDNRLLHGQILEAWVPRLRVTRVVIADDEAASSPLAQAAMTLAVPPGLAAEVHAVAAVDWTRLAASRDAVLVLVRDLEGLVRAAANGLTPQLAPKVNLGNVHYAAGRRPTTPSVFLGPEDLAQARALAAAGFDVEARAVPSDTPVGLADLVQRYDAAGEQR